MQTFTPIQYLKIDIANSAGLDKELFEDRIQWFDDHADCLIDFLNDAEEPAQFYAGMLAYQDVQAKQPTGYLVGLDATASGTQIMAAITGCRITAETVNLVNPNVRADGYTIGYTFMRDLLDGKLDKFERKDIKDAIMTYFYGSNANPRNLFGENTVEHQMFIEMLKQKFPGAFFLRNDLIDLWQPNALAHHWTLPDGFDAVVKVMTMKEESFEVNELNSSFTHRYWINEGQATGLSLAANIVHSIDGMVVREMGRRANYNPELVRDVLGYLNNPCSSNMVDSPKLDRCIELWKKHKFVSVVVINHINETNSFKIPLEMRMELVRILSHMLTYKPYKMIAIHDAFKCHPNYMNHTRHNYIDIFAQLADSNILQAIASQITGKHIPVQKYTNDLSTYIRNSNYMLS